jgi:hypothetical protein
MKQSAIIDNEKNALLYINSSSLRQDLYDFKEHLINGKYIIHIYKKGKKKANTINNVFPA